MKQVDEMQLSIALVLGEAIGTLESGNSETTLIQLKTLKNDIVGDLRG